MAQVKSPSAKPLEGEPAEKQSPSSKKWTKSLNSLKNSICPQCSEKKPLIMSKTYLEHVLKDKGIDTDVNIISCNECAYLIKLAHKDAELEHKNTQLLIQEKINRILKLKLEFYSDEETEEENADEEDPPETDEEEEEDSQIAQDSHAPQETQAHPKMKKSKVFDFKTLKLKTKRLH